MWLISYYPLICVTHGLYWSLYISPGSFWQRNDRPIWQHQRPCNEWDSRPRTHYSTRREEGRKEFWSALLEVLRRIFPDGLGSCRLSAVHCRKMTTAIEQTKTRVTCFFPHSKSLFNCQDHLCKKQWYDGPSKTSFFHFFLFGCKETSWCSISLQVQA